MVHRLAPSAGAHRRYAPWYGRHVDDCHLQTQLWHIGDIAFAKRLRDGCDSLIARAEDGHGEMLQQFRYATRVVGVVVRE